MGHLISMAHLGQWNAKLGGLEVKSHGHGQTVQYVWGLVKWGDSFPCWQISYADIESDPDKCY